MGLQRTPPPGRPSASDAGPSQPGNTSLPSPSQAFAPRNPRVMRSPQSGSTLASSSSARPEPTPAPAVLEAKIARNIPTTPAPQHLAPAEEGNVSTTPSYAPPAPARVPSPLPSVPAETTQSAPTPSQPEPRRPEPTTPGAKRRKSHHPEPDPQVNAQSSNLATVRDNAEEISNGGTSHDDQNGMYGKRYQTMMDTLAMAVKNSSHRMT